MFTHNEKSLSMSLASMFSQADFRWLNNMVKWVLEIFLRTGSIQFRHLDFDGEIHPVVFDKK